MLRGDQLSRKWRLLPPLGQPEGLAVEHVAREVGCTVCTVWRDRRVLQDAGFPIYPGRQDRRMEWAGAAGAVACRRDRNPFSPYLVFGRWPHAGSGPTFGLGGSRIEP